MCRIVIIIQAAILLGSNSCSLAVEKTDQHPTVVQRFLSFADSKDKIIDQVQGYWQWLLLSVEENIEIDGENYMAIQVDRGSGAKLITIIIYLEKQGSYSLRYILHTNHDEVISEINENGTALHFYSKDNKLIGMFISDEVKLEDDSDS